MSKAKFEIAKGLISAKKYDEARVLLETIDHPTAKVWLEKLDRIAPPKRRSPRVSIVLITTLLFVLVGVLAVVLILSNRGSTSVSPNVAAIPTSAPTLVALERTSRVSSELFAFDYPNNWIVESVGDTAYLYSSDIAREDVTTDNGLPNNALLLEIAGISPLDMGLREDASPDEAVSWYIAQNQEVGTFSDYEDFTSGNSPAIRVSGTIAASDVVILMVKSTPQTFVRLLGTAREGQIDQFEPIIDAIARSVRVTTGAVAGQAAAVELTETETSLLTMTVAAQLAQTATRQMDEINLTNTAAFVPTELPSKTPEPSPTSSPTLRPTVTTEPCIPQQWHNETGGIVDDFLANVAFAINQQFDPSTTDVALRGMRSLQREFSQASTPTCLGTVKTSFLAAMNGSIDALDGLLNGTANPSRAQSTIEQAMTNFANARMLLREMGVDVSDAAPLPQIQTATPIPTFPPLPTTAPPPTSQPLVAQIGPIWDSLYDESYNMEVTLLSFEWSQGSGYQRARGGNTFVVFNIQVRNLGPGTLRNISKFDFQVKDGNGVIRDSTYASFTECEFDMVDLTAGGNLTGCAIFEVPDAGSLELIYAPFRYEGLQPGRYISFRIR